MNSLPSNQRTSIARVNSAVRVHPLIVMTLGIFSRRCLKLSRWNGTSKRFGWWCGRMLNALKHRFKVDVFCAYRSNCDHAGFEVSHKCLELFTALEVPFGASVIVA